MVLVVSIRRRHISNFFSSDVLVMDGSGDLRPTASQFVEEFFVQSLVGFFGAHRQENVSADEFVNNFAIGRQATEDDVFLFKLHHHVLDFPVDVPGLLTKEKKYNKITQNEPTPMINRTVHRSVHTRR
jgi:hypothetical protein